MGGCAMWGPADAARLILSRDDSLGAWADRFVREVGRVLEVPVADQQRYLALVEQALAQAGLQSLAEQALVVVDRNPQVQAAMVVVRKATASATATATAAATASATHAWHWLGATAVSTGKPGRFEHFITPLGVFAHSLDNPDYRAQGTRNKNHIRGYGARGRRVFDFGWQEATRGWGNGGISPMRLQMHATDPDVLEPKLGQVASEGCIRIPATLNAFLDSHGVLDADYEAAVATGKKLWVLKPQREPMPWPGRYMVIVDTQVTQRPLWSPLPTDQPHQRGL